MTSEAQTFLIAVGTGAIASAGTLLGVWMKAKSDLRAVATSSPAASMEAISAGFEKLVERLSTEVDDLRAEVHELRKIVRELRLREEQLEGELRQYQQIRQSESRQQ